MLSHEFGIYYRSRRPGGIYRAEGQCAHAAAGTTQIQEQTLAFVPKIVAVLLAILFFGPWILTTLVDFTFNILDNLYKYIG